DTVRGVLNRLTSDAINTPGVWSPDSQRIFYGSVPTGHLFEKAADGARSQQTVLASPDQRGMPNDWSPNGHILLYENSASGIGELWALPLGGDRKPFPVVRGQFAADEGQFSPDGRWIAYRSTESGREEIYVQPLPGPGGKVSISMDGGSHPRW